jgi:DNA excision repair protein ERCC-6
MKFTGDDAINLTNDDSDPTVFSGRTSFIQAHCEPYIEVHRIDESLSVPLTIWNSLFPHQRVGVEWLWGLWKDQKGGIEGDEMGLGKTAIVCVFILALVTSNLLTKPVLVLCPLTVAQQWIRELHIWCPQLRSILLHGMRTNQAISDEDILGNIEGTTSVIVTNYETLHRLKESMLLHFVDWGIVVCDEGHKIRNHESAISKLVKRLTADLRLAVSGSPIQNSLVELWSLFDFAVPGLLGTLDVFEREYADPIKAGGYTGANSFVVFRAYTAAVSLRDLIKPFLLRRVKSQVHANLPGKSEQIFFVKLTPLQERAYQKFLNSSLCRSILSGHTEAFTGIDHLRKVCNHPALLNDSSVLPEFHHSAKLVLLRKILPQWQRKSHRALIFSQYLAMLSLIETLMDVLELTYFRIDGKTGTMQRQVFMDRFNAGERFACLLSTHVGGVGVNLMGADRVVIVDPDWNPSTDNQALERAFRIGQTRDVSVYRLISVGTIEEKMYKKQIFKQFLSNKILQSPNQRQKFRPQTLRDLFSLDIQADVDNELTSDDEAETAPIADEEKQLMQSLYEDGDIQHVFRHDALFAPDAPPETELTKSKASSATQSAAERLRQSVPRGWSSAQLVSRVRDHTAESDISERLTDKLLRFFRANEGHAATKQILEVFREDSDAADNTSLVKQILRRISVLNKKTHVWHLMGRFRTK